MAKTRTFEDVQKDVITFIQDRNWDKINTPKDVAISISLEANELLEHFQWQDTPTGTREEIADELADILIYALQFGHHYNIDILEAITSKLQKQTKKYPVESFKNKGLPEQKAAWTAHHKRQAL